MSCANNGHRREVLRALTGDVRGETNGAPSWSVPRKSVRDERAGNPFAASARKPVCGERAKNPFVCARRKPVRGEPVEPRSRPARARPSTGSGRTEQGSGNPFAASARKPVRGDCAENPFVVSQSNHDRGLTALALRQAQGERSEGQHWPTGGFTSRYTSSIPASTRARLRSAVYAHHGCGGLPARKSVIAMKVSSTHGS